ncbi:MAG TPA: Na-translocating system protein MpsC family protein [Thermoleophilaceae bacterium]|nr:Na-translocating system protein MpsC family protein [Thermoleophilaceae bacterium]
MEAPRSHASLGDELAEITNGIVRLFSEYYGRGPTQAKTYILEDRYVVTVLRNTMTTVERTLAEHGETDMVRRVRLTFQEAMASSFKGVVEDVLGRRVEAYHSQILVEPDVGFEFFLLEP